MVRRRTRALASSKAPVVEVLTNGDSSASALANAAAQLLEDQYFASPKRKDCKIEETAGGCVGEDSHSGGASPVTVDVDDAATLRVKLKASSPNKMKGGRGSPNDRTIGVPLATRSQTRTIENFFRANAAAKQNKLASADNNNRDYCGATESQSKVIQPTLSASVTPPQMTQVQLQHIEHQKQQINGDHNYQQQTPPPTAPPAIINRHSLDHVVVPQEFIFDLSEDTNDSEQTDLSEGMPCAMDATVAAAGVDHTAIVAAAAAILTNGFDFSTHRSAQRADSHSSSHSSSNTSATENIFLQEPVLTLNVDKSPNQASSIKINKTLEVEPKFSSPTSLTASVLNGRFNQIVSLNTSPSKRDSFGYEKKPLELNCHDYALLMLPENDNSSCDSGVAFHTTVTTTTSNNMQCNGLAAMDNGRVIASPAPAAAVTKSRRKPATPHRILCPSPIKAPPRVISPSGSPTGKMASALSPRKSQRHQTTTAMAAANGGAVSLPAPNKTRRRLNPASPKEQQSALDEQGNRLPMANGHIDDPVIVLVDDDVDVDEEEDDDHDIECENMATNVTGIKLPNPQAPPALNGVTKSILNSAKHPTNQQNATNNKGQKLKTQHKTKYTVQRPQHAALKHQAPQPLAATNGNREINDFFPVRRSVRKTKTAVKEEMMRNLEQAILEERCEGLKVAHFDGKGRGIIAERRFQRGEFVIEYVGDLISMTEAAEREKRYALDENAGCYMYYFKHKNQQYCIDATEDTGKLGRLVNHSRNGNLMTKVVVVKQKPHLVLIAKDDIEAGEELCYDYGDRSKESLLHHPWLAF